MVQCDPMWALNREKFFGRNVLDGGEEGRCLIRGRRIIAKPGKFIQKKTTHRRHGSVSGLSAT